MQEESEPNGPLAAEEEQLRTEMVARFSRLWCEEEPAVRLYFRGVIFNASDVPDMVQRTALAAFRKFPHFEEGRSFRAWVLGIAYYEALAYMRDSGREQVVFNSEVSDKLTEAVREEKTEEDRRRLLLAKAMRALPKNARLMLKWHYQEGASLEEVGRRLGMAEGTVRVAICRLRQKLRVLVERLEKSGDGNDEELGGQNDEIF